MSSSEGRKKGKLHSLWSRENVQVVVGRSANISNDFWTRKNLSLSLSLSANELVWRTRHLVVRGVSAFTLQTHVSRRETRHLVIPQRGIPHAVLTFPRPIAESRCIIVIASAAPPWRRCNRRLSVTLMSAGRCSRRLPGPSRCNWLVSTFILYETLAEKCEARAS